MCVNVLTECSILLNKINATPKNWLLVLDTANALQHYHHNANEFGAP